MKETTVKLSGHSKDQFLERFFAAEVDLDAAARQRLIARTKAAISSLRVRKATLTGLRQSSRIGAAGQGLRSAPAPQVTPTPAKTAPVTAVPQAPAPAAPITPEAPDTAFDAYAIGLVPVFQREGRDGLIAKLAAIDSVDHLRQMAKAQQIVLPQPLRLGEATAEAVREGIADSVAKRIADRKAAAR